MDELDYTYMLGITWYLWGIARGIMHNISYQMSLDELDYMLGMTWDGGLHEGECTTFLIKCAWMS